MSLHLLPHSKIVTAFSNLRSSVQDIESREQRTMMKKLFDYMDTTWIDSVIWPPNVWSVYMQQVFSITNIKTLII